MTPEQFERVRELFDKARRLPTADQSAFVAQACPDDELLRDEVLSLLRANGNDATRSLAALPRSVLNAALGGAIASDAETTAAATVPVSRGVPHMPAIPGYTTRRLLGEGGMGAVYEAEQRSPRRLVALKLIRAGLATRQVLRRFEVEKELLGRLEHPGIARIYEAGTADAGHGPQPYFAMELVRGRPLTAYAQHGADSRPVSQQDRLALLAAVCDAVQYAHQRGVIHRDLKPSNILVTDQGQPKVLDFGVARATDADFGATLETATGQIIGTVQYMSPEQAAGDPRQVDTRSDVFALGLIGYELLAGRPPHNLSGKSLPEALRVIREEEPQRVSTVTGDRTLRGDVDTIIAKALAKEKERRYAGAAELAADIRRYLSYQPIAARAPSNWYYLSRFARRNRGLVGGVFAALIVLLVGIVVATVLATRLHRTASDLAVRQGQVLAANSLEVAARNDALAKRDLAELRRAETLVREADALLALGRGGDALTAYQAARELFTQLKAPTLPADLGLWDAGRVAAAPIASADAAYYRATVLPDGRTAVAQVLPIEADRGVVPKAADGEWWEVDLRTLRRLRRLPRPVAGAYALAVSPTGRQLLLLDLERGALLWDLYAGRELGLLAAKGPAAPGGHAFAFSPDGSRILGVVANAFVLWDAASATEIRRFAEGTAGGTARLQFFPDGRQVAALGRDGAIQVWDISTGSAVPLPPGLAETAKALATAPPADRRFALTTDGTRVVVASADGTLRLIDLATGRLIHAQATGRRGAVPGACSPDGRTVLIRWSGGLSVWDLAEGGPLRVLLGIREGAFDGEFAAGGLAVAGVDRLGGLHIWAARPANEVRELELVSDPNGGKSWAAFAPDGRTAIVVHGHVATLHDLATARLLRTATVGELLPSALAAADAGHPLTSFVHRRRTIRWDVAGGTPLLGPEPRQQPWMQSRRIDDRSRNIPITCTDISPDGAYALVGFADGVIEARDPVTGQAHWTHQAYSAGGGTTAPVTALAVVPETATVLACGFEREIVAIDLRDGRGLRRLGRHEDIAPTMTVGSAVEPLPGGRFAMSVAGGDNAKVWDVAAGRELRSLSGHPRGPDGAAIGDVVASSDGQWMITLDGRRAALWDLGVAGRRDALRSRAQGAFFSLGRSAADSDPASAAVAAEWWALHGVHVWAAELYEQARSPASSLPQLSMAQSSWQAGRSPDAGRLFGDLAARAEGADREYLSLCRRAAVEPMAARDVSAAPALSRPGGEVVVVPLPLMHLPMDGGRMTAWPIDANGLVGGATDPPGPEEPGIAFVDGTTGRAAAFNGATAVRISGVGVGSPLNRLGGQMTVAFWFLPQEQKDGYAVARWMDLDQFQLAWVDGRVRFMVAVPGNTPQTKRFGRHGGIDAPAKLNQWTHLAGVFDGTTLSLYLDGQLAASALAADFAGVDGAPPPYSLQRTNRPLQIGGAFRSLIDEVRLYDVALTASQIAELATTTRTPAQPHNPGPAQP